jgi:hypothetical protein
MDNGRGRNGNGRRADDNIRDRNGRGGAQPVSPLARAMAGPPPGRPGPPSNNIGRRVGAVMGGQARLAGASFSRSADRPWIGPVCSCLFH